MDEIEKAKLASAIAESRAHALRIVTALKATTCLELYASWPRFRDMCEQSIAKAEAFL